MMELLKDRYKTGLALASLFVVGIAVSIYQVYRLPHNMMVADGYHPALTNVFLILGITFFFGAIGIWITLNNRTEVIVFKDKQIDIHQAQRDTNASQQNTISVDSVKDALKSARGQKDVLEQGVKAVCKLLEAGQGAAYAVTESEGKRKLELKGGYALSIGENTVISFDIGEGLIGQSAASGKTLYIDEVPEGYVKVVSGLGIASPKYLLIVPVKNQETLLGVVEIASFTPVSEEQRKFVEESAQLMADKLSGK